MRTLYFGPVSFFFFFLLFSSLNLSGRRLDIYHTSTHGVALVWIQNADLKYAACCSLEMPKIRHLGTIAQFSRAISSQLKHVWTTGKNLLNSNVSPHVLTIWWTSAHQRRVWGTPANFNSITARHSSSGCQPHSGVEQRAPPTFGRVAITLGIGQHF